jgi:outer membrane protein TolC
MGKTIQDWIREGEELHTAALQELQQLESQLSELEQKRSDKLAEVNQIAGILGKPPSEPVRHAVAVAADDHPVHPVTSISSATIARALAGKGLNR